jgi:predicted phosphoribosyltransferase
MLMSHGARLFYDRVDAGRRLGESLKAYRDQGALVLAIPRGGVPVAAEVARYLRGELDVVVARKLGVPGHEELAMGAVAASGGVFLNEDIIADLGVSVARLSAAIARERQAAEGLEQRLRGGRARAPIAGRVVIVVDDGLATGATMRAAVQSVRKEGPSKVVVAVPVGSREACAALSGIVDDLVCVAQPEVFLAVGLHYTHFEPTTDEEVRRLLTEAAQRRVQSAGADLTGASQ